VKVWFYWALNPNSGDTGGLLEDDWRTPVEAKLALLRRLMPPSSGLSFDFLPALGEVPNPERGFAGDSYYPDEPSLDAEAKVAEARSRGFEIRLIRRTYYLHAFANQDTLPTAFLNTLAQDLASAQAAGVKLILRFAYRPDENHPSGPTYCDPPEERILAHQPGVWGDDFAGSTVTLGPTDKQIVKNIQNGSNYAIAPILKLRFSSSPSVGTYSATVTFTIMAQ
jgi:endoglucanase